MVFFKIIKPVFYWTAFDISTVTFEYATLCNQQKAISNWSISIKWDKPYPKSWTEHFLNRSLTIRGLKNLGIL